MKNSSVIFVLLIMSFCTNMIAQNFGQIGQPGSVILPDGTIDGGELDSIAYLYSQPGGNVTIGTAYTNIDSITLDSGVWYLSYSGSVFGATSAGEVTFRIRSNTNHAFSANYVAATYASNIAGSTRIMTTGSTIVRLQAIRTGAPGSYASALYTKIIGIKLQGY